MQKYKNKKIAIYGLGKSGYSAARLLKSIKAKIYCWDDNQNTRKKIKKKNFSLFKFWKLKGRNKVDYIVISPGIDINNCKIKNFLKKNKKKIITDLDLFYEMNKRSTIIAITGTNGKSTTCKIVEKILRNDGREVVVGGNIGKPALSLKISRKSIIILEISSYQLAYSKLLRSNHSVILNISPDHLERHKNLKNYTKIKSRILLGQKKNDFSYINHNNVYSNLIKKVHKKNNIKSKLILIKKNDCNFIKKRIRNKYFTNKGNIENSAFAYEIAKNLNVSELTILKAINEFKGLPHRQEIVFSNNKLTCINDSKATSFEASLQSLTNFNKIYWILGGLPKLNDSFNLKEISKKILKAYIIGKSTSFFVKQIKGKVAYSISHNIKNAIKSIFNNIKKTKYKKNIIIFSPAAASYDQFKNFEDRGNNFKKLILKSIKK